MRRALVGALARQQAPLPQQVRDDAATIARALKGLGFRAARLSPALRPWFLAPLEAALLDCGIQPQHDSGTGALIASGFGGIRGEASPPARNGTAIFKLFGTEVSPGEANHGVVLAPLAAVARVRLLRWDYPVRSPDDAADRAAYAAAELSKILARTGRGQGADPFLVWADLHPALTSLFEAEAQRRGLMVVHHFVGRFDDGRPANEAFIPAIGRLHDDASEAASPGRGLGNPLLQRFYRRLGPDEA
ncbi:hypothetical protein [Sabulicella glaciei]|uniref:Uncharacterized protein n=1 Tax=Sabulicella glaciei TaxID=2984948 RepID=A0ABT3P268_9PROT|nr:hypothetical protein [Roseococcus sp. MDT2-1-1]MCW8088491.1 hypothetical protein [Roseococcus sp. MDT2-1-1]